ncbi:hypothetical protein PMAYCL1PPCAC_08993, partial [Pristionchus mayeri]
QQFPPAGVRLCTKEGCTMFNQLICVTCALDGDHGGHVVKYDVYVEKIRMTLKGEVNYICSKVDERKSKALERTEQLMEWFVDIKK